jgi:hypothetical protein
MKRVSRKEVRSSPLYEYYCSYLRRARIEINTQRAYASVASSWMFTLSQLEGVATDPARDSLALVNARNRDLSALRADRKNSIAAITLSLSYKETCDAMRAYLEGRSIPVQASRLVGLGRFHEWLSERKLIPVNHLARIRPLMELRDGTTLPSLQRARRLQNC